MGALGYPDASFILKSFWKVVDILLKGVKIKMSTSHGQKEESKNEQRNQQFTWQQFAVGEVLYECDYYGRKVNK